MISTISCIIEHVMGYLLNHMAVYYLLLLAGFNRISLFGAGANHVLHQFFG